MSEPKNSHTPGGAGGLAGSVAGAGTAALASGSAGASGSGFTVVNAGAEARAGGAPALDSDGKDGAPARPLSCLTSSAPWELRMRRLRCLASDAEGVAGAESAPTWNQREDAGD